MNTIAGATPTVYTAPLAVPEKLATALDAYQAAPPPPAQNQDPPQASVGDALWSAVKWGAVGGVLSAVPFMGYGVSTLGGAIAASLLVEGKHKTTALLFGGVAGLATHVIPMSGWHLNPIGSFHMLVPATVIFGALTWGYIGYRHARGNPYGD